jgi:predicted  nucleic acid-binding Zn-ribbon protein
MDDDLKLIVEGVERLLGLTRRLSHENSALRDRLAQVQARCDEAQTRVIEAQVRAEEAQALANETQSHIDRLKRRSAEARARVEAALERLPSLSELAVSPEFDEAIPNAGPHEAGPPTELHSVTSSDFTNSPL